jgi:hypothetical protein
VVGGAVAGAATAVGAVIDGPLPLQAAAIEAAKQTATTQQVRRVVLRIMGMDLLKNKLMLNVMRLEPVRA